MSKIESRDLQWLSRSLQPSGTETRLCRSKEPEVGTDTFELSHGRVAPGCKLFNAQREARTSATWGIAPPCSSVAERAVAWLSRMVLSLSKSFVPTVDESASREQKLYSRNGTELFPGDIVVFPDGAGQYGAIGALIPGRFYHAALYIGNGQFIEADQNGVRIMRRDQELISKCVALRVNATEEARALAVEFARKQLGKGYDWNSVLNVFTGGKQEHGDTWYCSELAWASYSHQNVDLDANPGWSWENRNWVTPAEIADSPLTTEI